MALTRGSRRGLLAGAGALAVVAAVLPLTLAEAAAQTLTPTVAYGAGADGAYGTPQFPFTQAPIKAPEGNYAISTNLWNPAVAGSYNMAYDDATTAFTVSGNTANSYFPNGDQATQTGVACTVGTVGQAGVDPDDPGCNWAGQGNPWAVAPGGASDQFGYTDATYGLPSWLPPAYLPADAKTNHLASNPEYSHQIHAPASYPSIIAGCHWGNCTGPSTNLKSNTGVPFPLQGTSISRLESVWQIDTGTAGAGEAWDASYDIWYDTNVRGVLPANPINLNNPGQADGTEIMIWVSNAGYNNANPGDTPTTYKAHAGIIQPAGVLLKDNVTIPGVQTVIGGVPQAVTFDVWGGRVRSFDNGIRWNVVSFVARTKGTALVSAGAGWGGFDAQSFGNYAAGLDNQSPALKCSTDAASPISPQETVNCLEPTWWMTGIQAGFEIWNLPSSRQLKTNKFSVNPVAVSGGVNTGGRATDTGIPLVNWQDTFNLTASGCPGATNLSWSIAANNYFPWGTPDWTVTGQAAMGNPSNFTPNPNQPLFPPAATPLIPPVTIVGPAMTETAAGSGNYVATGVGPMLNNVAGGWILHGPTKVTISMLCPGSATPIQTVSDLYIDPSGKVVNTLGAPIQGATVTLSRSNTQTGTFTVVPNGSTIMSPANRVNPDLTKKNGNYRWDVTPGWYKVRASKSGCTQPGSSQTYVESAAKQVAVTLPPITNLTLVLYCGEVNPTPTLPTTVVVRPPGIRPPHLGGYCADVYVTNNTGAPVEWVTSFNVPGNQRITQKWNVTLTQSADNTKATNVRADPSNPWNKILQPGATTFSVGFCTS